jgi:hypothetical protein
METLSAYSDLILALSAAFIAASVFAALIKFFSYNRIAQKDLALLREREFHSSFERLREQIESEIARLNHQITDTRREFEQVNHLLVDAQQSQRNLPDQISASSQANFLVNLGVDNKSVDENLVFVLTPFHTREKLTYSAIVEAFTGFNAKVLRGDEEPSDNVLQHIIELLMRARIVIANISSRNPNVMYELGIAHTLGKPVILISSTRENDLPFDLRNQSVLFYRSREDLVDKLRNEVARRFFAGRI